MLEPLLHILNVQKNVLASGSIRRKEILEMIGLNFDVIPSECEENLDKSKYKNPGDYALATALLKTKSVADHLIQKFNKHAPDLIIGADTVVACDGYIYEKPSDEIEAGHMLNQLGGKMHTVHTGVILLQLNNFGDSASHVDGNYSIHQFCESTDVYMAPLSMEVIKSYVATREPLDKAGAYGIQGKGGALIEKIHGDYYNVVGFPLHRFCVEINRIYNRK